MATTKQTRKPRVKKDRIGLSAIGSSDSWQVAVDEALAGPDRWFLQIEGPSLELYFEIPSPRKIKEVLELFLEAANGNGKHHRILLLGGDQGTQVSLVQDNEFAGRWYVVVEGTNRLFARYALNDNDVTNLARAMNQVQDDLDEDN